MKCLRLCRRVQKHAFDISGANLVVGGTIVIAHFVVKQPPNIM